jgi:hypothetical protein
MAENMDTHYFTSLFSFHEFAIILDSEVEVHCFAPNQLN